uniref:Uncharacterized protein n=1 Tax=Arundo donax TaxID=35708 RepID=A0A0A9B776_ARUDO
MILLSDSYNQFNQSSAAFIVHMYKQYMNRDNYF